uniref:Uncharacterized protein n=1 Tax=Oryza punctata TaxID=4537 RepID=A0A0E0LRB6_ORYPU
MGSGDEATTSKHHRRDKDNDRDRERSSSSRHHHRDDMDGDRGRHHREKERDREERKARERRREESSRSRRRGEEEGEGEEEDRHRKRRRRSSHHHHHGGEAAVAARVEEEEAGAGTLAAAAAAVSADGDVNAGKKWTLDGEESDEEGDNEDTKNAEDNDGVTADLSNGVNDAAVAAATEEDEIDPLDAFMNSMVLLEDAVSNGDKKGQKKAMRRIMEGDDSDSDYDDDDDDEGGLEDEDDEQFMKRVKKTKVEKLAIVDHSKIDYQLFQKNFYIEVKDITRMTGEEVTAYRKNLELKVHGKDVPKPIKTWVQSGLTSKLLDTIKTSRLLCLEMALLGSLWLLPESSWCRYIQTLRSSRSRLASAV